MSKPRQKIGMCAYCGEIRLLTRDHIPPDNLFPHPKPSDLITVPCCESCRVGWSDDDEYFRLAITTSANVAGNPQAQLVHTTVLRSLQKPTKAGFAAMVRKSLTQVDRITPGGLYIETVGGMKVDRRRIIRVANRIIRGLFFHEHGYRVPEGYEVINQDFQFGAHRVLNALGAFQFSGSRVVGGGIFAYSFASADDDPDSTFWFSKFYGAFEFAGMTLKPAEI